MKRRILSFVLSAIMLLTPAMSVAEAAGNYYAGELTKSAIGDSYAAGNQLNLNVALGMDLDETIEDETLKAIAKLLGKMNLQMSFYDDFGTTRIHSQLEADDVLPCIPVHQYESH